MNEEEETMTVKPENAEESITDRSDDAFSDTETDDSLGLTPEESHLLAQEAMRKLGRMVS